MRRRSFLVAMLAVAVLAGSCRSSSAGRGPGSTPGGVLGSTTVTERGQQPTENSAHRIVFWTNCKDLVGLSDAQLVGWRNRGVGGFMCGFGALYGAGGSTKFTTQAADPTAPEQG